MAESQILYSRGEFDQALETISQILSESQTTLSNFSLKARLVRADIYREQEKVEHCNQELDNILEDCQTNEFTPIKIEVLLRKCSLAFYLGDKLTSFGYLNSAREIWTRTEHKNDLLNAQMIDGRILRYYGRYSEFYGNYEEARESYENSVSIFRNFLDFADLSLSLNALAMYSMDLGDLAMVSILLEESKNLCDELDNPHLNMKVENLLGNLCQIKGEFEKALEYFTRSLEFASQNNLVIAKSYIFNYIGLVHQHRGDNETSLKFHHKSLEISKLYDLKNNLVICYNNIGIIHLNLGDLDKAWEFLMISLQLGQGVASEPDNAGTHNNIGIIYTLKGELEMAFQHHMIHLQTSEKYQLKPDMATAYVNIGQIRQIQGNYDQAKDYFLKCLKIDYEIGNVIDISETIYNIIILEVERGDTDAAANYLEELNKLDVNYRYILVKLRKQIASAILNKSSDRFIQKAKAQDVLSEISKQEVIDSELSLFAKFNLCDLLFNELRITGNEKVLQEIKDLIDELLKIAQDQNSSKSLSEIYLLQSKLSLIEADLPKAHSLLHDAEDLARSKGLTSLSKRISNQFDLLLKQGEMYNEKNLKLISIRERIESTGMDQLLSNLINKKNRDEVHPPENPAFFLILSAGGLTIYQKNFKSNISIKNELIGGLLTAIHNLSSDVFAAHSSTQRIRHNQFTVIIHPVEQLLFTYVFIGSSYNAMGKVELLIKFIRESPLIWESLNRDFTRLTKPEIEGLDLITSDIFLTSNIEPTQH